MKVKASDVEQAGRTTTRRRSERDPLRFRLYRLESPTPRFSIRNMVQDRATSPPIRSSITGKENDFATSDLEKGNPPNGQRRTSNQAGEEDENEREGDEVEEPALERAPSSARSQTVSQREEKPKENSVLPLLSTISLLIFATIWGVLARLGLLWIGGFAEGEVFSLIWAQMVGCLVMGLVVERKKGLEKL